MQKQHEQNARLLWAEIPCHDGAGICGGFATAFEAVVGHDPTVMDARRDHHGDLFAQRVLDGLEHRLVHVAHAQRLDHDSFRPLVDRAAQQGTIGTAVHGNDLDLWHGVAFDRDMLPTQRLPREDHAIGIDLSEQPVITRLKGLHVRRMGLGHVTCGVDLVVHGQQDALVLRLLIDGNTHRVEQVARTIEVRRGGVALCADDHDRLFGLDSQVKPESGFLQRIGAVRDDDA